MLTHSVPQPVPAATPLSPVARGRVPPPAPSAPGGLHPATRPRIGPSLEELLRPAATYPADTELAPGVETLTDRQAFGVFYGLRSALLVYACLAIACGVAYELWSVFGP